jgi:Rab5 GDP/GTP exchange factor
MTSISKLPNPLQDSGTDMAMSPADTKMNPNPSPIAVSSKSPLLLETPLSGLGFDFHRFLEQLRHRTADPVAKFLRSFLIEFGKKQWMAHEQAKIIGDFLAFIANKMAVCEVWGGLSDVEFDNAKEGMEKLVMNRLYSQTFPPEIPPPLSPHRARHKRKPLDRSLGRGRSGQHQEDIERDEILAQKVRIYGWVREEHLDILPIGDSGRRFLHLAQQGM